jgi:hypothetical protein
MHVLFFEVIIASSHFTKETFQVLITKKLPFLQTNFSEKENSKYNKKIIGILDGKLKQNQEVIKEEKK